MDTCGIFTLGSVYVLFVVIITLYGEHLCGVHVHVCGEVCVHFMVACGLVI